MPLPTSKKRRRLAWIIVAVLVVGGIAGWLSRPAPADVVTPVVQDVVDLVVVSGRLRAVREAAVGVEITGMVEEVLVREGDSVAARQPIARVGLVEFAAQRQQALARRDTAAADVEAAALAATQAANDLRRAQELGRAGVNSPADVEAASSLAARLKAAETAARARLAEDESLVRLLDQQLEKRTVRAPFAGVITRRSVEPGQSVAPGSALFLLAEMSETEIYAETDENNLGRLQVGQPATVIAPAFRNQPFQAQLIQIGPRVDWDRGVVGIRFKPEALPGFVLPNMTVDVNVEVGRYPQATTLPPSALLRTRDGVYAMVVRDAQFERRAVSVLGENPTAVAITGLAPTDRVAAQATRVNAGQTYRLVDRP
jgi:HlyD family secretion protein